MDFKQFIEASNDLIFRLNESFDFTFVNPALIELTGFSEQELLQMNFYDLLKVDTRTYTRKFYQTQINERIKVTYHEMPLQTKDGGTVWIGQNVTLLQQNEELLFTVIARNISEKVKIDNMKENWILRLSVLIENLQEGVLMEDENRKITLVNRAFCDLFSVRLIPEDLIGKNYVNAQNHIKRLFENPTDFAQLETEVVTNKHIVIGQALNLANGRVYERDYVPIYVETGYAGNLWKYRDCTEKVKNRNELIKSKKKYKNVIETMRLGLLEVDHDDNILQANEAFCEILEYDSPEQLIGKKSFETLLDEEQQELMRFQMANRNKGDSNTYEIKVKKANGDFAWMLISGAPLFDEQNNIIGSVGIHLDITYQKRIALELEEKKNLQNMMEWQEKALLNLEEKVLERTSEVLKQKEIIEEKNTQITNSIEYARRIQQAILPDKAEVARTFEDSFIMYRPRDIVGGDFYYFKNKRDSIYYLCAADSTGHGVPGGFMSMLGSEKLKDAVSSGKDPGEILSILNRSIKNSLNSSDTEITLLDGFDVGLSMIDIKTFTVSFAGALRPMWIIHPDGKDVEEVKGTRRSIGGRTEEDEPFETHQIKLNKGDCLYLFTDGFNDQFNKSGKRMTSKRFRELLLSINDMPMKEQGEYLEGYLETWMGGGRQTDDILVIGVRL
jgi:PAS domain S-box-containing protein